MPEFQEVMREWGRMCKTFRRQPNGCTGCPLVNELCYRELPFSYDPGCVERKVMVWAAEHPELIYPTWYEFLTQRFHKAWEAIGCDEIPAELAEKLGVQPEEVKRNEWDKA